MFFMSRSRRVCSSTEWSILRQAQHDEVVILGKVNRGGAEELLKGQGRGTMTTQFRLVINNSMKSLILLHWVPIILVDVGAIV